MSFQGFSGLRAKSAMFPKALPDYGQDEEETPPTRNSWVTPPNAVPRAQSTVNPNEDEVDDPTNYLREYKRLYDTPGPATSAYKAHLATMPKQEDYKPSGWTRAAAGLSGISAGMRDAGKGIEVAQGLNQSRYRQALGEYGMKEKNLGTAAKIEDQETENKIKFLRDAETSGLNYRKYLYERDKFASEQDLKRKEFAQKVHHEGEQEKEWQRIKGSDLHYMDQEDGSIKAYDPNSQTTTIIPGKSAAAARIRIQLRTAAAAESQASTAAENARTNALRMQGDIAHQNRADTVAERNVKVRETRPGTPPSATQQDVAEGLALDQMAHDKKWKPYISDPDQNNRRTYVDETKAPTTYTNYQAFKKELAKRIREIAAQGGHTPEDNPYGDFEEETIPPVRR